MNIRIEDAEIILGLANDYMPIIALDKESHESHADQYEAIARVRDAITHERELIAHRKQIAELDDLRGLAADEAFAEYEMPEDITVEDSDGWELVSGTGDWVRTFYTYSYHDKEDMPSRTATFRVRFAFMSDTITHVTATFDDSGSPF